MACRFLIPCYLLLFLLVSPHAYSQQLTKSIPYITKDSLPKSFGSGWRYHHGDLKGAEVSTLSDSSWKLVNPVLYISQDSANPYDGISWLRYHFNIDTSLAGKPLALIMTQAGASEVYVDGRLVTTYGSIGDRQHIRYYDPHGIPLAITLPDTGAHVVAVRYANWAGKHNQDRYRESATGFEMELQYANNAIPANAGNIGIFATILMILFGIFGTLAISHLLLYLYHRAGVSNLWFSIFSTCIALGFLIPHVVRSSNIPSTELAWGYWGLPVGIMSCCAFSGLISAVFSRRWLRFYIIAGLCAADFILYFINYEWCFIGLLGLVILVPLEAVIIIILALYRRVRGITIIGTGMLLFALLILFMISSILINGGWNVSNDTTGGKIFLSILGFVLLGLPLSMSAYLAWSFATLNRNLGLQLTEVKRLSDEARVHEAEKQRLLETRQEELEREVQIRTEELRGQKKKSDDLLLNILPAEIAEELKENGQSAARQYDNVSVLFTDFVDFTQHSEGLSPTDLVAEINHCFSAFDSIIGKHGLEKIKTVGDAYIAVSGMPAANGNHAEDVVRAALEIKAIMEERVRTNRRSFGIRLGVHSGPVVAGIVGIKKFAYDIWGDTVNTAARMEQHSEPGKVNISSVTYELVKDAFACTPRGDIEVKHKGRMQMYFVEG